MQTDKRYVNRQAIRKPISIQKTTQYILWTKPLCALLCTLLLSACGRPDTDKPSVAETQDPKAQIKETSQIPQFAHSKIAVPNDFPREIPIPSELQLEWHKHNAEEQSSVLEGLMAGKMRQLVRPLNDMMLEADWKANLVLPQSSNTLMHYTKGEQSIIIELRESVNDVTIYNITYTPISVLQADAQSKPTQAKTNLAKTDPAKTDPSK